MICVCGHMDDQHITTSNGIVCYGCEENNEDDTLDAHHPFQPAEGS